MYTYPNGHYNYLYKEMQNTESTLNWQPQQNKRQEHMQTMQPHYFTHAQNLQQQMNQVEKQLSQLIRLIEENNRLLRSMQQQQRVTTSGGGAVIVRM